MNYEAQMRCVCACVSVTVQYIVAVFVYEWVEGQERERGAAQQSLPQHLSGRVCEGIL